MSAGRPEVVYRAATDKPERLRLRAAVIKAYRPLVERFVRRSVPAAHVEEGEQVGCIGLLLALEEYDSALVGEFRFFAFGYVRDEVQRWIEAGEGGIVHARPRPSWAAGLTITRDDG